MPSDLARTTDPWPLPALSSDLAGSVDRIAIPDPGMDPWLWITDAQVTEAQRALAGAATGPASRSALITWLMPIAAAVRNPPGPELDAKIGAIAQACSDLPAWVWSGAAQSEAMRRWAWWPAAADVHELLTDVHGRALARLRALRRIASWRRAKKVEPTRSPRTPEEIAATAKLVEEWRAEVRAREEAKPQLGAIFLTPAQLREARRASGLYPFLETADAGTPSEPEPY